MKRILLICAVLVFSAACATGMGPNRKAHYPNRVTPDLQASFDAADALYQQGNFAPADAAFAAFIEAQPYTELTDEARFRRGEIAFSRNNYSIAVARYAEATSQIVSPMVAPKARFKRALALMRLKRPAEALKDLRAIPRREASAVLRLRIDSLGVLASQAAKVPPNDAILWNLYLLDDYAQLPDPNVKTVRDEKLVGLEAAEIEARRWIDDPMVTLAAVQAMPLKSMKGTQAGGYVAYKEIQLYHRMGDTREATRALKSFLRGYPKHDLYGAGRLLMSELGGMEEMAGVSVGVILPLTGRYAVYGASVLHGIECAGGIFTPCVGPGGVAILIRDSESTNAGAVRAVEELAAKEVVAIIGPLRSTVSMAAAQKAQELGVPMVTLSQQAQVTDVGSFIFRNSISTESEINTLVDYAIRKKGLRRIFVLYPDNRKGAEYFRIFSEAAAGAGGRIVASKAYKPNQMEFASELRGRGFAEHTLTAAAEHASYDAVFIPDSAWAVGYIAPTLALMGIEHSRLLGISRWNDSRLIDRGGKYVEDALFVETFYKGAPSTEVSSFVTRFREAYGVDPTLLEALGYDSMRMIISNMRDKGAMARTSMRDALARTTEFPGVAGRIAFDPQGNATRRQWVLTVKNGAIVPVK